MRFLLAAFFLTLLSALATAAAADQMPQRPTLTVEVQSSNASGADEFTAPNAPPLTNVVRVPFQLDVPLAPHVAFRFQQQDLDFTLERVLHPDGTPQYPGSFEDTADDASVAYINGGVRYALGYYQRHTVCCTLGEDTEHLAYLDIQAGFVPLRDAQPLLTLDVEGLQSVHHRPAATGAMLPDSGNLAIYRAGVTMHYPVGGRGFSLYGKASIDGDYFNGAPVPFYYNELRYGFVEAFSPNVSYRVYVSNLVQRRQGVPFAIGNGIERAKVMMTLSIRVPF